MMDNLQLESIIIQDKYAKRNFCGVIPIDYLPKKKLTKTCSFIVNTDNSSEPGKHWVAIYAPIKGYIEYYDPFGLKPLNIEIYEFININKKNFTYNAEPIQSSYSSKCGLFCLFYILLRSRKISTEKINKFFNNFTNHNDYIIEKIFKHLNLQMKN